MAIEVKVLYATPTADPLIWTQPYSISTVTTLAALGALPSASVLALSIFKTPPGTPRALISRMYPKQRSFYQGDPLDVIYGTDKYGVGNYVDGAKNWVFWDQWNDEDDTFFAIDLNDLGAGRQTFTRPNTRLPPTAVTKVFSGAYVHPTPDWEAAKVIIDSTLRV